MMWARSRLAFAVKGIRAVRLYSYDAASQPRIRIGSIAPNFKAQSTVGEIDFHKFIGNKWTILFSHPADFTPVCTTELGAFAALKDEFAARNAQLIGLSVDGVDSHSQWVKDIEETTSGGNRVNYPIVADPNREIAFLYDMVDESGFKQMTSALTIRNVFIIDPEKKIRLFLVYPASVGRNTAEVLRTLDALQLGDKQGVVTPVNWEVGQDVILPLSVSVEDGKSKFGDVKVVKPYLRFVRPLKSTFAGTDSAWSAFWLIGLAAGLFVANGSDARIALDNIVEM